MSAFVSVPFPSRVPSPSRHTPSSTWRMQLPARVPNISRRALLYGASATAITSVLFKLPANAKVDIDIERFGDKELKVSTINKVKQNVRNVLTQKPELLPYFFSLTLHDALTFNPETDEGGPNGSLRLELDRPENGGLKEAAEEIAAIQALQRQDMSFADTCAFAGAVAVEVTGGPRIIIQLGREDAKEADPATAGGSALYTSGASASELRQAFNKAGLDGSRDVVLFHGAVGSLNDIGQRRAAKLVIEDDGGGEDGDEADLDDVTYGKVQSKKRGAVLVETNVSSLTLGGEKFSNSYLKALAKAKDRTGLSRRDTQILEDKEMRAEMQRYADNNGKFVTDVANLYQKVSLLGSSFESMTLRD